MRSAAVDPIRFAESDRRPNDSKGRSSRAPFLFVGTFFGRLFGGASIESERGRASSSKSRTQKGRKQTAPGLSDPRSFFVYLRRAFVVPLSGVGGCPTARRRPDRLAGAFRLSPKPITARRRAEQREREPRRERQAEPQEPLRRREQPEPADRLPSRPFLRRPKARC